MRPRLLDLFCSAGGSAAGWHAAGFDVVGVDSAPQPDYPYEFHRGNALTYPLDGFDAATGSPPCKLWTPLRHTAAEGLFEAHVDCLTPTRERFIASGLPYVIENVVGAPLLDPVMLCGSMFGLGAVTPDGYRQLRRHRLFESNVDLRAPGPCAHKGATVGVYGSGGSDMRRAERGGGGGVKVAGAAAGAALGIDWHTDQSRLSQAIPPAYTRWLGAQLLDAVKAAA